MHVQHAESTELMPKKRIRFIRRIPGERVECLSGLSVPEEKRRAMVQCIDGFYVQLSTRTKGLKDIADMFQ